MWESEEVKWRTGKKEKQWNTAACLFKTKPVRSSIKLNPIGKEKAQTLQPGKDTLKNTDINWNSHHLPELWG